MLRPSSGKPSTRAWFSSSRFFAASSPDIVWLISQLADTLNEAYCPVLKACGGLRADDDVRVQRSEAEARLSDLSQAFFEFGKERISACGELLFHFSKYRKHLRAGLGNHGAATLAPACR